VKILIVDDEIHVASMLADVVIEQGHEVSVASDGEEGLALIREGKPDVLFLDVMLGELSGIEVLRRVRRTDPDLPVIIITGHARSAQLDEARRLGVTEIVQKPFLLNQIDSALGTLDQER
jgi:DNA-binding response OmpR family regulator